MSKKSKNNLLYSSNNVVIITITNPATPTPPPTPGLAYLIKRHAGKTQVFGGFIKECGGGAKWTSGGRELYNRRATTKKALLRVPAS